MLRKNILTILTALAILYLSLAGAGSFQKVRIGIPHIDKVVHACMYFALTTAIIIENRKYLPLTKLISVALIAPLLYGILMEFLQMLTPTRTGSFADALFDFAGILVALGIWFAVRMVVRRT